jgi:hypothetical protein
MVSDFRYYDKKIILFAVYYFLSSIITGFQPDGTFLKPVTGNQFYFIPKRSFLASI